VIRQRLAAAHQSEQGGTLMLAIGFVLMIGAISAGLLGFITTSVSHRSSLEALRNRQYAADGAVEYAISTLRGAPTELNASACPTVYPPVLNGFEMRVDCDHVLSMIVEDGLLLRQRSVIFNACVLTPADDPCAPDTTVVSAQVTFAQQSGLVIGTSIQSWSVNK
jgi:hypothetical protein